MLLEIVAHCYRYSRLLAYQATSLIDHPPPAGMRVRYTVFYTPSDSRTVDMLDWFVSYGAGWIEWRLHALPPPELYRRAIGRNRAALATEADWIWFADCDYVFGPQCLASLPEVLGSVPLDPPLVYPRYTHRTTQEHGDELIDQVTEPGMYRLPPDAKLETEKNVRAIGGIQILRGSVARERGYLNNSRRWQQPIEFWQRTWDDTAFRRVLKTRGRPVLIADMHRVRHSKRGRLDRDVEL